MASWLLTPWFLLFIFTMLGMSHAKVMPFSATIQAEKHSVFITKNSSSWLYRVNYFTQLLDHFTYTHKGYQTFQQRYLINDTFWGGPDKNASIFVYLGGEADVELFAQNTGFVFDTVPRFRALIIFIEACVELPTLESYKHRFYGKSVPVGGNKSSADNASTIGYLTSTQALADYATLVVNLKNNLSAIDSPVVVFGVLAAWLRLKYPHITIGALASSAPILNFENITSPYNFFDTITRDFRGESENCYLVIKGSWKLIEDTASQPGGPELLQKSFKLCNWLYTAWIYTAVTDYPTASDFLANLPAYPVKQMCNAIDNPITGNNTFRKLYGAASVFYNYTGAAKCLNLNYCIGVPVGCNGWLWQACTEMILPKASNKESMFPAFQWSFNYTRYSCGSPDITPRPTWIPTEFGGHNIKRVLKRFGSNIIFFNGLRDPWSGGAGLEDMSNSIIAIVAKEGAHHVDLRFATSEYPKWLQDVRKRQVTIIAQWLSQYYHDLTHLDL